MHSMCELINWYKMMTHIYSRQRTTLEARDGPPSMDSSKMCSA